MSDCIFCKIAQKEIPAKILKENEYVLAFRDISPQAPVHILVIPKKHINSMADISSEDARVLSEIHLMVRDIAAEEGLTEGGYRVVVNCGKDAGQAVAHLHYHLLGGRKFAWPPG